MKACEQFDKSRVSCSKVSDIKKFLCFQTDTLVLAKNQMEARQTLENIPTDLVPFSGDRELCRVRDKDSFRVLVNVKV